jgi:hypothetical protein
MKQATLNLEPSPALTRPIRVTPSTHKTACAAAPALDASASAVDRAGSERDAGRGRSRGAAKAPLSNAPPCDEASASIEVSQQVSAVDLLARLDDPDKAAAAQAAGWDVPALRKACEKALTAAPDADEPPTKAPAGPRSKAARIITLARALGVQSDAEAGDQLAPF